MTINPENPFLFNFIVDSGNTDFNQDQIKQESNSLVKYFLAAMTVPQDDLWVNLSPYEENRIIPEELGRTELGRDMLAQDYLLKQLSATLMHPEKDLGKKFWKEVRQKVRARFGDIDVTMDTFNKVWIMPEDAAVYEHENTVYITKSRLKIMTEQDYLAVRDAGMAESEDGIALLQNQIIKEIILPEIEREVNEGENFAPIRQIYNSLILAQWYKETVKESLLSKVYVDQNKIKGVDLDDPTVKDQIYAKYIDAFKVGVFNFIKEDYDELRGQVIPRQYFSGGEKFKIQIRRDQSPQSVSNANPVGDSYDLALRTDPVKKNSGDSAMLTDFLIVNQGDFLDNEQRGILQELAERSGINAPHFLNVERFRQDDIRDENGERKTAFLVRSFGKIKDDPNPAKQHNSAQNGFIIEGDRRKVEEYLRDSNILEKATNEKITLDKQVIDGSNSVVLMFFRVENEGVTYEQMVKEIFNRSHASTKIVENVSSGIWQKELQDVVELINGDEPSIRELKKFAASTHFWVRIAAMSRLVDYEIETLNLRDDNPEDIETKSFLLGYKAILAKAKEENSHWKGTDEELLIRKAQEWENEYKKRIYE
jgi:hypothetical protein